MEDAETITRVSYDMNLGGKGLPPNSKLPAEHKVVLVHYYIVGSVSNILQCPAGTWICETTSTKDADKSSEPFKIQHVIPIAGHIRLKKDEDRYTSVNATAAVRKLKSESNTGKRIVTLNGGFHKSRPNNALIRFYCNRTVIEPSQPIPRRFNRETEEISLTNEGPTPHLFEWSTKHACPSILATPSHGAPSPTKTSDKGITHLPDDLDSGSTPSRRRVLWAIGTLCILLSVIYAIYFVYQRRTGYTLFDHKPPHFGNDRFTSGFPQFSRASIIRYLKKPFRRRRMKLGSQYHPLFAEEYEIPDIENEEGNTEDVIVDFQTQSIKILDKKKNSRGHVGYGTVR
ncbi:hypothetical protein M422DRAFT_254839 [Sphaerobolus stellatus SS14]|uniref:Uncharacterized protein n=1 Tax=Sphaerobolus stellatus (strain SS14) TaxID=990650 RepID=A0A0C9V5F6_SPHS4|nr:hypothetical protein M422DRAFT_254839 [Sphaerobolus stellatus SS14]